jgi:hypothetical protein
MYTSRMTKKERSIKILHWAEKNLPLWWDLDLNTDKWEAYLDDRWCDLIDRMKDDGIYAKTTPSHYLAKNLPAHLRFCANEIFGTDFKIDRLATGWWPLLK